MLLGSESCGGTERAPSRRVLFGVLLGYFALQIAIRTLLSSSADLDETDQLVLTQKLSWGYGPQPPLYTWIQMAVFGAFGVSIFSLSLFKNLLLLCTYALTYLNAHRITGRHLCGAAAAVSLFFIPQVAWESQRDLTHSVLSATLAAATLCCFLHAHERRQTRWYLLFGVCSGLGLLSKYNYVFWLLGLVLAAFSLPELRATMLDWRMGLALALAVLIFLPNGLWILDHRDLAFLTASKFGLEESSGWFHTIRVGTTKLLVAVVSFIGPLLIMYLLVFLRKDSARKADAATLPFGHASPDVARNGSVYVKLLWRTLWVIAIVLVVLVLGFRATDLRERWLQPILICAPVLAVTLVRAQVDWIHFRRLALVALVVMLSVLVIMPGRIVFAERLKREEPLNHPYDQLAAQIKDAVHGAAFVVTDTRLLAGNLRLAFPNQLFVSPELVDLFTPQVGHPGPCLVVWDATRQDTPPKWLRRWMDGVAPSGLSLAETRYFAATYKYHHHRELRLGMLPFQIR